MGEVLRSFAVRSRRALAPGRAVRLALVCAAGLLLAACQGFPGGGTRPPAPQPPTGPVSGPVIGPGLTPPAGMPIPADPAGYVKAPNMAGEPIRVGVVLPLSHPSAEVRQLAQAILDAAQLAVFESGNREILLMPRDDKGTPEGATAAVGDALSGGAEIIIGPLFATSVSAAGPLVSARNIPMIAFSTDRAVATQGIYLLSFQPEEEVARVVQFAREQGRQTFAGVFPQSPYGGRVEAAYRKAVVESGGVMGPTAYYTSTGPNEMLAAVRTLGTSGFDAIILPEGGAGLRTLAPLLPFVGIDSREVRVLGTGLWDDPQAAREPSLVGGWFAAPDPVRHQAFEARFKDAYGYQPPRIASLGFDAVSLVHTYSNGLPFQRYLVNTFLDPNGYAGIDGILRFRTDGSIERGLAVIEVVSGGQFKTVAPAPRSFERPGF